MDIGDLMLISQNQQLNLQNFKHNADLNRVEINTSEYVKSLGHEL